MGDSYQSPPSPRFGMAGDAKGDKSNTPLIRYSQIPNNYKDGYYHNRRDTGSNKATPRP